MTRRWSFYDLQTGEFTGRQMTAPDDKDLKRNTPSGWGAIEGAYDPNAYRVDLVNGVVVDWVNAARIEAQVRRESVLNAQARIAELETKQQRVIREASLRPNERGEDGKQPRDRLQEIDDEIAALRAVISAGTDTSAP
jgi:hypothetical protein